MKWIEISNWIFSTWKLIRLICVELFPNYSQLIINPIETKQVLCDVLWKHAYLFLFWWWCGCSNRSLPWHTFRIRFWSCGDARTANEDGRDGKGTVGQANEESKWWQSPICVFDSKWKMHEMIFEVVFDHRRANVWIEWVATLASSRMASMCVCVCVWCGGEPNVWIDNNNNQRKRKKKRKKKKMMMQRRRSLSVCVCLCSGSTTKQPQRVRGWSCRTKKSTAFFPSYLVRHKPTNRTTDKMKQYQRRWIRSRFRL